jgi:hypothetical protein
VTRAIHPAHRPNPVNISTSSRSSRLRELVVDLRLLTAVDGVGANVLLGLYHYIVARGGVLRVTGACEDVTTTLQSVGEGSSQSASEQCQRPTALSNWAFDIFERPRMPRRRASS